MSQAPQQQHTGRLILIGTVLVVVSVVAVVGWQRGWLGHSKYDTPPLSADYLPADTGAVLHVKLRELQDSKGVNKELGPSLRNLLNGLAPHDLQKSLGVDPAQDIDWMQLTLHPGDAEHPLDVMILMAGKFDPAKFKPAPKGLRQINKPGDRYRLYELPDERLPQPLIIAPGERLALMSDRPARVANTLADAAAGTAPVLEDQALAEQVRKIDRQQTIWGVASLKKLQQDRPLPRLPDPVAERYLRPIFEKADLVYGGITCGNDIQGTVSFRTDSDEKALLLEAYLREKRTEAIWFAMILPKNDYLPLLRFLGSGKVTRDGQTVTLDRCHLP